MHNFILQVSTQPILADEYITSDDDDIMGQLNGIADWAYDVSETEAHDIAESIIKHELLSDLKDGSFAIDAVNKRVRLATSYMDIQEIARKLDAISLEDFITSFDIDHWKFKFERVIKGGDNYIYFDETLYSPLEFIRIAQAGQRYYVGGVINYHW